MKQKLSITLEEDRIIQVEEIVKSGKFRNKSHFIEVAVSKLLEEN